LSSIVSSSTDFKSLLEAIEQDVKAMKEGEVEIKKLQGETLRQKAIIERYNLMFKERKEVKKEMNKKVLWEAIKDPVRLFVLAIIPFAISYFTALPASWAVGATFVLQALDKYLHELWKIDKKQGWNGLTGF